MAEGKRVYQIFGLALTICLSLKLEAQKIYAPDNVTQGQILQAFVHPMKGLENVQFILLNSNGKVVVQSDGFLFNYERGALAKKLDGHIQDWVNIGLIGISPTQEPGNYTLRASIEMKKSRNQSLERAIYIQEQIFPSQTIQVSKQMDRALNPKNPDVIARQRNQSQRLWAIIKRHNWEDLYYSGELLRPVEGGTGWTSSPYGYIRKYVYPNGKITYSAHKGHDIAAPKGVQVLASGDGLVVMAEERIITGKTVMIALLPGVYLKYQHMSTVNVTEGDILKRGELIGEVGKTGFATGSHLHTELWVSGQPVDPSLYFAQSLIDTNIIISMIEKK